MKKLTIITVLFIAINAMAQEDVDTNSNFVSLKGFKNLVIKGSNLTVNLIQEEENSLEVFGDKINKLEYQIEDSTLKIEADQLAEGAYIRIGINKINFIRVDDVVVINAESITTDSLSLKLTGVAKISFKNLQSNILYTDISGAAELNIIGKCNYHHLEISGAGDVKSSEFETKVTELNISGAGEASVYAKEKIAGQISGTAKLEFYGDPQVNDIKVSGTAVFKGKSVKTESDTVSVKIGNYNFEIFENDGDDSDNKKHKHDHESDFTPWSGLDIGVAGIFTPDYSFTMPDGYEFFDLDYKKSIKVGLNIFEKNFQVVNEYVKIGSGLGIDINNYRFVNDTKLLSNKDTFTGFIDTVIQYEKSKLRLSYLNIPLLLEINTSKNEEKAIHFATGLLLGYNIGSKTKLVYNDDGMRNKEKSKGDYNVTPFRYAVTARVGYGNSFMLYATYDLSELFLKNQGPELYPFSVGLSFVDF